MMTCRVMFDMFSLTSLCEKGAWHFFTANFFVSELNFDHGMMTVRDMFDMFSLTCLSCDMVAWHFFSLFCLFSSQTLTMGS